MKGFSKALVYILLFFNSVIFAYPVSSISNYTPVFIAGYDHQNAVKIAIRSFKQDGKDFFLVVNPQNLSTEILAADAFKEHNKSTLLSQAETPQALSNTPYFRALAHYSSPPYPLANDGLIHADHSVNGYFLTIDMCPSKKPFESDFFNSLTKLADKKHQAIPVAISMSGLWLVNHRQEFASLLKQQAEKKLQITWVNHSMNHAYNPRLPLDQNFLLMKNTDFSNEVFGLEKLLLAQGQSPSVFFRFPGLISNEKLIKQLTSYGLIPLGADAWLAKGQQPVAGSIILVHGNSNESEGIKKIMPLLENTTINWLPLSATLTSH